MVTASSTAPMPTSRPRCSACGIASPTNRGPRFVGLAIPQAEQRGLDVGIGAVDDAVTIHVATGAAVPDLQLGGVTELQARRLEPDADLARVDGDGDQHRVAHGERTDARNECGIGGGERQEWMGLVIDGAAVVDLYRPSLAAYRPE